MPLLPLSHTVSSVPLRSQRKLRLIRGLLWVAPLLAAPIVAMGGELFEMLLLPAPLTWAVGGLALLVYLGYQDALVSCEQRLLPPRDARAGVALRTVGFVLAQAVVLPGLAYLGLWLLFKFVWTF